MSIIGKLRYWLYSNLNMDVNTRKDKFIKNGGVLGEKCEIFPDVEFGSEPYLITIGDNVRITNGVRFATHDGGVHVLRNMGVDNIDVFGKIIIGDNVFIGWNSIILPNVTIGNNVVIGAGSIVTHSIPDNCVVAGNPAKIIKSIDEYKEDAIKKGVYTKNLSWHEKRKYLTNRFND